MLLTLIEELAMVWHVCRNDRHWCGREYRTARTTYCHGLEKATNIQLTLSKDQFGNGGEGGRLGVDKERAMVDRSPQQAV